MALNKFISIYILVRLIAKIEIEVKALKTISIRVQKLLLLIRTFRAF